MEFDLRFTDKEITAWGGMGLMKRMLDHLGFDAALTSSGLPQPGSNRGYRPEQLITYCSGPVKFQAAYRTRRSWK